MWGLKNNKWLNNATLLKVSLRILGNLRNSWDTVLTFCISHILKSQKGSKLNVHLTEIIVNTLNTYSQILGLTFFWIWPYLNQILHYLSYDSDLIHTNFPTFVLITLHYFSVMTMISQYCTQTTTELHLFMLFIFTFSRRTRERTIKLQAMLYGWAADTTSFNSNKQTTFNY